MRFVKAECPNCGGSLDLEDSLNRASCPHCGSKYLVKDAEYEVKEADQRIPCPRCKGHGRINCFGVITAEVTSNLKTYELFAESCMGDGKCYVTGYPQKEGITSNYCVRGKCAWCNGTGKDLWGECNFCKGTGDCRFCKGTATCIICNGKGIRECKACQGRGYTVYNGE